MPGPFGHLAVSLLAAAAESGDPNLVRCVDQIEPAMSGAWGGATFEERCALGVARSVAKSIGQRCETQVCDVLARAGIVDWYEFMSSVVAVKAGPYAPAVAGFHEREDYRWVPVVSLPVPRNPTKLPDDLFDDWERCTRQSRRRPWVRQKDTWVRAKWISGHRNELTPSGHNPWPLANTDWSEVSARVREFYDHETWSRGRVDEYSSRLPDGVAAGFRATLYDPIVWGVGADRLGNGQRRSLVVLAQGVESVLVCGC